MEVSVNNNSSSTATTVRPRPTSEVRLGIARAELLHGLVSLVGLGPDGKEWRLLLNEELCRPRVPSVGELVAITPPWSLVGGVLLGLTDIKLLPPPPVSGVWSDAALEGNTTCAAAASASACPQSTTRVFSLKLPGGKVSEWRHLAFSYQDLPRFTG